MDLHPLLIKKWCAQIQMLCAFMRCPAASWHFSRQAGGWWRSVPAGTSLRLVGRGR